MTKTTNLQTEFDSASESPGFLLWKASNLLQRQQAAALKEVDLTPAQFSVLASIVYLAASIETELTQSVVVSHTGLDKMFISDLTRTLAKKNLIQLKSSRTDARAKIIHPTSSGVKKANAAVQIIEKVDRAFFSGLENPPRFVREMNQLLNH